MGYVHTKPDKFENAIFAAKRDKMFSVHINRFQTVSLSKIFVGRTVLLGNAVEFAEARLIRAPNTQCFDVYVELLHNDCIAQRLSLNKQSKVTTGTIT